MSSLALMAVCAVVLINVFAICLAILFAARREDPDKS
jgi:hypothetical protein